MGKKAIEMSNAYTERIKVTTADGDEIYISVKRQDGKNTIAVDADNMDIKSVKQRFTVEGWREL